MPPAVPNGHFLDCNDDGTAGPNQQDLTLNAGDTLTAYWAQWTHLPGLCEVTFFLYILTKGFHLPQDPSLCKRKLIQK
jgi:hypothetical protein